MPNDMTAPAPLTASLVMTQEQYAEIQREQGALEVARAYKIEGTVEEQAELAGAANLELQSVKRRIAIIEQHKDNFIAPAESIIASAKALFNPGLESLRGAETTLKAELTDYTARERTRIADEKRKAEDAARLARQKAEQEAAAARARAEQEAQQRQREADEAEKRRLAAVAEGNDRAAKAAAAEKAKAEEQVRSAIETGEAKAQTAQLAASAAAPTRRGSSAAPLKGFSTRDNWGAEMLPGFDDLAVKVAMVEAIATQGRADLLALLQLDMSACNKLAKALHEQMNVPGLAAKNNPIGASRAA